MKQPIRRRLEFCLALPMGLELSITFTGTKVVVIDAMELRGHKASLGVENQWYGSCMTRRVCQEDADSRTIGPFVVGVLALEGALKNVSWGPKGMKMIQIDFDLGTGETGSGGAVKLGGDDSATLLLLRFILGGQGIAEIDVMLECSRPERGVDSSRPTVGRMEQGGPGSLCYILDSIFGFTVLMVCVDTAKRECLSCFDYSCLKNLSIEKAVIGVIVLRDCTMRLENSFKC